MNNKVVQFAIVIKDTKLNSTISFSARKCTAKRQYYITTFQKIMILYSSQRSPKIEIITHTTLQHACMHACSGQWILWETIFERSKNLSVYYLLFCTADIATACSTDPYSFSLIVGVIIAFEYRSIELHCAMMIKEDSPLHQTSR